jgi:phospholipid transport system substrate-binding protein
MNGFLRKIWILCAFMMMGVSSVSATEINQKDPQSLVAQMSQLMLDTLNNSREELSSSQQALDSFAEKYVLPYVDTEKMARYATGRYWRTATVQQQEAFVAVFTEMLLRSYSNSFLKLQISGVTVGEVKEERPGRVTVSSEVKQADGNVTSVVYRAYQNRATENWYLYDVAIEGVSTLISFRSQYDSEIGKKGMDQVIAELQAKNAQ